MSGGCLIYLEEEGEEWVVMLPDAKTKSATEMGQHVQMVLYSLYAIR